jgi:cytochrome oxidase Cu insertion factor (SCO1/SenC/PrrC family)
VADDAKLDPQIGEEPASASTSTPPRRARGSPVWMLAFAGMALAVGLLVLARLVYRTDAVPGVEPRAGGIDVTPLGGRPAPPFSLLDQHGERTSLSEFRGKVVVLTFIDSRCKTICPLTAEVFRDVQRVLGPSAAQVQLLAVNANPDHTSVNDVREWSVRHGMLRRWEFLTGRTSQLRRVWVAYAVSSTVEPNGEVSHIPAVYVIDQRGGERAVLLIQRGRASFGAEVSAITAAVRPLLQTSAPSEG